MLEQRLLLFAVGLPLLAQAPKAVTAGDYAHAEKFLAYYTTPLVLHAGVRPRWVSGDRFTYRTTTENGTEFFIYDAAKQTREPAIDHAKVAAALSAAAGTKYEANKLPFLEFERNGSTVTFTIGQRRWTCNEKCVSNPSVRNEVMSPDRKRVVFLRDYNLWLRDVSTGKETKLTSDGIKDFGYATDNAGWQRSERPIVAWSPDSRKIATYQQDQRGVGAMYLVDTRVGHPHLESWKYPLPGDAVVTTIQRVIIDVEKPRVVRLKAEPDQRRGTLCDDISCRGGEWGDVQWSRDGAHLAFVSTSRDHKREVLRVADADTGAVRDVFEETVATFFESGNGRVNWRYLPASNEVLWFSERDNWGHLYVYDLDSGKVKNQVTRGNWNVTQLLRVDEANRVLYFLGAGREKGRDPYFNHFYKVGFDGKGLTLLTPEEGMHEVTISPSGTYFVDVFSKPDTAPIAALRDSAGKLLAAVEKADISRLIAAGWKPPMPFTVKARDGVTDLYGLMYKPASFDPNRRYPIVNHIYPGPQAGSVGSRSFMPSRGDTQALAELGFIVVQIEGMGNPYRSKKFHEAYYGNLGDNTLPDQITGMKQLAAKYPWIDLERAGIYGHSGGGYATAAAMFKYPDFFKAGVSEAGNHDNRNYEDDWAEKWMGLLQKNADGRSNYDDQANQNHAKNLKGHLLLAHGTMDTNVPPYNTLLVVNELIKANKDFDLILLPNRGHGFGNEPYMVRRRWDYFVRYLMGAEPPKEFELKPPADWQPQRATGL